MNRTGPSQPSGFDPWELEACELLLRPAIATQGSPCALRQPAEDDHCASVQPQTAVEESHNHPAQVRSCRLAKRHGKYFDKALLNGLV